MKRTITLLLRRRAAVILITGSLATSLASHTQAAAGDIYVAGPGNTEVYRYSRSPGNSAQFASGFTFPGDVAIDRSGNVYVLEDGIYPFDGKIIKITPAGQRSVFLSSNGAASDFVAVAVDVAGNVYVADNRTTSPSDRKGTVNKYAPTGVLIGQVANLFSTIAEMAFDPSGSLYMTTSDALFVVNPQGQQSSVAFFSEGAVYGVACDSHGNVFVGVENGTILKITPAHVRTTFATGIPKPNHMTIDDGDTLFVSSATATNSDLYKIRSDGTKTHYTTTAITGGSEGFKGLAIEPPRGKSLNISTRVQVQTGDNALIGGFIITGTGGKRVMLRAIGPSLASAGVPDALQDPVLQLYRGATFVNGNDNWRATQETQIAATGIAPTDDRESAFIINLAPESYTVVVRGKNNTTGVGLVEVYDLDEPAGAELANISTRGVVQTGDNVMIGGFIVGGNGTRGIVRGLGPSLTAAGISGALIDTTLSLRNADGVQVGLNDDWQDTQRQEIIDTGIPPADQLESAIVTYFGPGNYTAILSGYNGATGVGLIEFYNLH